MIQICQHCGQEKENCYNGFISMCLPIPEMEALKEKYGQEWWNYFEKDNLTEEQTKELDNLNKYDQFLNTVGRGIQCNECSIKEEELYNKYYPKDEIKNTI